MISRVSVRDAALAAALVAAIALTFYLSWSDAAFDWIAAEIAALQQLVATRPLLSTVLFFAGVVVAASLCFPAAPLLGISAGFLFGFWWGLPMLLAAMATGSTFAFLGSRYLLRDWAEARFGARLDRFRRAFERHGPAYLLMVRFNPFIPYWLVNLVVGLTAMRLRTYVPLTIVGLLPASLIYALTGSQLHTLAEASGPSLPLILAMLVLSLAPLVPIVAERWRDREKGR